MSEPNPPPGFEPLFRTSPFLETVGPLFCRKHAERGLVIGLRVAFAQDPPAGLITASLTADFAGAAKLGDWVEAHVDIQKVGGRLAFANAFLMVDGERIVRASAVFARAAPLSDPKS